jgi:hypothetical protein
MKREMMVWEEKLDKSEIFHSKEKKEKNVSVGLVYMETNAFPHFFSSLRCSDIFVVLYSVPIHKHPQKNI